MSIGRLFGVVARGEVEPVDGAPVVTQFMTVAGLPLIPIVSWYAAGVARQEGLFERVTGVQEDDVLGVRRRLHGRSVLFGYARGWLAGAAVALGLVLFIECVDHRPLWARDPERFGAMTGGLVAALLLAGLTIPFGRRSPPRDAAIRRALGSVLGVPADLAGLHSLDVGRWRPVVSYTRGARDWERIVAGEGPPAHARDVAEALAQVRLELSIGKRPARDLEACTDALLERLASAPPPPPPDRRERPRRPEQEEEEEDDDRELDPAILEDPTALARHLGDERLEDDAEDALRALGAAAIPALIAALDDDDRKYAAHDLLVELGAAVVPAVVPLLGDEERQLEASMLLEEIGRPAVPALVEALRTGSAAQAEAALDLLRDLKAPEAIEPAVERAARGDLSWFSVGYDLKALDAGALFDAVERRLGAARDRVEALDALLHLDPVRGVGVVLGLARAEAAADPAAATDPDWGCEPLEALDGLGAAAPAAPLLAAADDAVPGIRGRVISALAWLTDPAARARVERAAREDPCADIRESAAAALLRERG